MAAHFEPVVNANYRLVAPPPTRRTAIGGYPKVASYDILGEQLHYSNPVKHGSPGYLARLVMIRASCFSNSIFGGNLERRVFFAKVLDAKSKFHILNVVVQ